MELNRNFYRLHAKKIENMSEEPEQTEEVLQPKPEDHMNFIEYVEKTMETFEEKPFCDADALVFSWLSYIDFPENCIPDDAVRLGDLYKAELFEQMFRTAVAYDETKALFCAAAASPRFRDTGVSHYVSRLDPETLKQFSAVNFHISEKLRFVAFRGTDKFIVGWKEDLCLALADPVESQKSSVRYLTRCASGFDGEIITGGHSKGGNLAIFSSALCDESIKNKITKIYSFDGPGVDDEVNEELIDQIYDKVIKFVPQSSLIGLIMEKREDYRIVKSDGRGFSQHMAFYWHLTPEGEFDFTDDLTYDSRILKVSVNKWIGDMNYEERSRIIQSLFEMFNTTNAETLDDIDFIKVIPEIKKNFDDMNPEARKILLNNAKNIITESVKNIPKAFEKKE